MTDDLTRRIFELAMDGAFRARYKVDRALGRGAMGVVLAGEQVSTGRRVAVKFMINLDDPIAIERMEREGQLLARVAHPGLTRILDAGSIGGFPFLVTELMTGDTLDDRIGEKGRLSVEEALQVCREVLPALQACHDASVVHRDLKPSNILYDQEGRARLADLGVARWEDAQRVLTATGQVIGTPLYVAPEMLRGELATKASDIYSFGCTLFEMLVGEPPFDAPALPQLLKKQMHEAPPRVDARVPAVPTAIAELVDRSLAKDPAARPESAAELLEGLEMAFLQHQELALSAAHVPLRQGEHAPTRQPERSARAEAAGPVARDAAPPQSGPASLRPSSRHDHGKLPHLPSRPGQARAQPPAAPPVAGSPYRMALALFAAGLACGALVLAISRQTSAPAATTASGAAAPGASGAPAGRGEPGGAASTSSGSTSAPASPAPSSDAGARGGIGDLASRLGDGSAPLPASALGRLGTYWGSHPTLAYLRFSPDGTRLATATHNTIRLWNPRARRMLAQWRSNLNYIAGIEVSAGGMRVVAALSSERMTRAPQFVAKTPENAPPLELAVWEPASTAARTVAGPSYCGAWSLAPGAQFAGWFDALTGKLSLCSLGRDDQVISMGALARPVAMAVAPDGERIALITGAASPAPAGELRDRQGSVRPLPIAAGSTALVWSPDGSRLAVREPTGVAVLDAATLTTVTRVDGARDPVWDPSGNQLAVRLPDGIAIHSMVPQAGQGLAVHDAPISQHDRTDAAFAIAGTAYLYGSSTGFQESADADNARPRVLGLDGRGRFAVVERASGFEAWHIADGRHVPLGRSQAGWALAGVGRDGRWIHFRQRRPGQNEDLIHCVDADTGTASDAVSIPQTSLYVAMSERRYLLLLPNLSVEVADGRGARKLIDAARLDQPAEWQRGMVCVLDQSERRLLLSHPQRGLLLLDLLADAVRVLWRPGMLSVAGLPNAAVFVEPTRELLMGSSDGVIHVQDLNAVKPSRLLKGPLDAIKVMALSADEKRVAGGDAHGGIAIWELPGGQVRDVAPMVGLAVNTIAIDRSGNVLAIDDDRVLTVWRAPR